MSAIKLSRRLAEESQLLAEEKWITEALKKIKTQRNCLQIERLHLESLKSQLKIELGKKEEENRSDCTSERSVPMDCQDDLSSGFDFDVPVMDESMCNREQLNLAVDNNMFGNAEEQLNLGIEEEEDEDFSEDILIDMNMLMNGQQLSKNWK